MRFLADYFSIFSVFNEMQRFPFAREMREINENKEIFETTD